MYHAFPFLCPLDFMTLGIEAMNRCFYLMRVGVSLAKTKNESMNGFSKNKAIIVGHMVRLCKLYDGYCLHICKRQLELAGIFQRLIIETEIRMSYLIKKGTKVSFDSYILASYRSEKETIADLNKKGQERELSLIEKRIRSTILKRLKEDKISQQKLLKNKVWNTDGKDTRAMLRALDREYEYSYLFGTSSRWVHGNWLELRLYHLNRIDKYWQPNLSYGQPDTRLVIPITVLCLRVLLRYIKWAKSDPDEIISLLGKKIIEAITIIDEEHEKRYSKREI